MRGFFPHKAEKKTKNGGKNIKKQAVLDIESAYLLLFHIFTSKKERNKGFPPAKNPSTSLLIDFPLLVGKN